MEDPTPEQVDMPCRTLAESLCRSRLWAGTVAHGEEPTQSGFAGRTCDTSGHPHWSSWFLRDCTPWKGPTLEQFLKDCIPWEGPTLKQFVEDCSPQEGPHTGAGTSMRRRAAEMKHYELTATPFPHCPALLGREEVELL